jgi:hypothetical protein
MNDRIIQMNDLLKVRESLNKTDELFIRESMKILLGNL